MLGRTFQRQGNIASTLLEIAGKASVEPTACKHADRAHIQTGYQKGGLLRQESECCSTLIVSKSCSLILRIGLSEAAELLDVTIRQHIQTFGISLQRHEPQHVVSNNCENMLTLMHFYVAKSP